MTGTRQADLRGAFPARKRFLRQRKLFFALFETFFLENWGALADNEIS
jgi:hypothetical protein